MMDDIHEIQILPQGRMNHLEILEYTPDFGSDCAFIVADDSMIGCRICKGDYVLVQITEAVEPGEIVVAYRGKETIFGIYWRSEEYEMLQSANAMYPSIFSSYVSPSFQIIGKVVAFLSQVKRFGEVIKCREE